MNIDKIIKKGLSGEQIGKLLLEDYLETVINREDKAKKYINRENTLREALDVKGLFTYAEINRLTASITESKDIEAYNSYVGLLDYLDEVTIKMEYFNEVILTNCFRVAYWLTTKYPEDREFKGLEVEPEDIDNAASLKKTLGDVVERIENHYLLFLIMKTSLFIIEEITEAPSLKKVLEVEPEDIDNAAFFLNMELEKINEKNYNKGNSKVCLLDLDQIEIPEENIREAKEKVKDISFFNRKGRYSLHHIIGGLD